MFNLVYLSHICGTLYVNPFEDPEITYSIKNKKSFEDPEIWDQFMGQLMRKIVIKIWGKDTNFHN